MNDNWSEHMNGRATHSEASEMTTNKSLAPDRFLTACPIKYDCRSLFVYLIEMEYSSETKTIETMLQYPEVRDERNFSDDRKLSEFIENVKKFAYPYNKTLDAQSNANRIRQYGFCRSAHGGQHILCLVSYLPWYNVFINILNKISTIINEKDTSSLYNFLEAIYEYELPEPSNWAQIFSHDGLDQIRFQCPDRRVIPSINENRNLLKFFAFFDLDKLIKIFTALLLERSILIVSKDLENLTSCALAAEYLLYPLEWLHTFVPIMPEHISLDIFNQPFPFIYGIHTCIYEKLNRDQIENAVILLVDERQVLNGDKDQLPEDIVKLLVKKLNYFQETDSNKTSMHGIDYNGSNSSRSSKIEKYDLLGAGPVKAFQDSVLMIIDEYRKYLCYDTTNNKFELNENIYFQMKNVPVINGNGNQGSGASNKYTSNQKEFYYEFRVTQAFEEFCRDRCDYLKAEKFNNSLNASSRQTFQKDFIDTLVDQFKSDDQKLQRLIDKGLLKIGKIGKKIAKEDLVKRIFNSTPSSSTNTPNKRATKSAASNNKMLTMSLDPATEFSTTGSLDYTNLNTVKKNTDSDEPDEQQYTSESSSTSSISSIKEAVRRERKPNTQEKSKGESRIAVDFSNDPELKKYFENNSNQLILIDEAINNNKSTINNQEQNYSPPVNLIDIGDEPSLSSNLNSLSINNNSDKENSDNSRNTNLDFNDLFKSNDDNPFVKDRFIDQMVNDQKKLNDGVVTSPNISLQIANTVLSPTAIVQPQKPQEVTYKSIIDEFDPISNADAILTATPTPSAKPMLPTSKHFENLTAKPFHNTYQPTNTLESINSFYQPKPNYNIHLPPSNSLQGFASLTDSALKANRSIPLATSQSQNFKPTINPFVPTPYYGFNTNNQHQAYRPVQFMSQANKTPNPVQTTLVPLTNQLTNHSMLQQPGLNSSLNGSNNFNK